MEIEIHLPPPFIKAARAAKVDPRELTQWILESFDASLVADAARNFKNLIDDERAG
ncbi:MAG: hypothetical protein ABIP97_02485 [Chthoniobacterales bacterium]